MLPVIRVNIIYDSLELIIMLHYKKDTFDLFERWKAVTLPQRVIVTLQLVLWENLMTQLTHPGDKSKRSIDLLPRFPPFSYSKIIPNSRKTNETRKRNLCLVNADHVNMKESIKGRHVAWKETKSQLGVLGSWNVYLADSIWVGTASVSYRRVFRLLHVTLSTSRCYGDQTHGTNPYAVFTQE